MSTQWNTSMAGITGLNYSALPAVMQLLGVPRNDRRRVFLDFQVMEGAVLEMMNKK